MLAENNCSPLFYLLGFSRFPPFASIPLRLLHLSLSMLLLFGYSQCLQRQLSVWWKKNEVSSRLQEGLLKMLLHIRPSRFPAHPFAVNEYVAFLSLSSDVRANNKDSAKPKAHCFDLQSIEHIAPEKKVKK
jgi:hypothetical protein